ncbi:transcriptional regulator [Clostridium sartagoforme AAU1]|uniref:Transcriptional regulator n=1 Tax=Clostridium sartagoforme AAU1 TaxID=1202534 RepID=R9CLZ9_9CLOT|nr:TetR/AcrR family transcriptional regulator [Clostridium sartagoforme]EOR28221.1 transcriptional regulator [Clostridium sartagoforme AAU1]
MNKENNRRAMLTKKILENKLIELLKEKRIEQISISKLCENAGINRSTFYKHYMNQYDLLNNIEKKVLDKMIDYLDMFIENNNTKTLELMLIYIQENKIFFMYFYAVIITYIFKKSLLK